MKHSSSICNTVKVLIHFLAYVLAAAFLSNCYQVRNSERELAQKVINATTHLIMTRMYELERISFALETNNLKNAEQLYKNYEEDAVLKWNIDAIMYYQQIKRYLNKRVADDFTPITSEPTPNTLFYYFQQAHITIMQWKSCSINNPTNCESLNNKAKKNLSALLKHGVDYIQELNDEYQRKYQSFLAFL
jgi:hypothetical protein